jgi:hypothetical protein
LEKGTCAPAIAALLLILPSSQASALCAGQSPEQKVIFEIRYFNVLSPN